MNVLRFAFVSYNVNNIRLADEAVLIANSAEKLQSLVNTVDRSVENDLTSMQQKQNAWLSWEYTKQSPDKTQSSDKDGIFQLFMLLYNFSWSMS